MTGRKPNMGVLLVRLGPSLIITFGEHTGGELYVHGVGRVGVRNTWQISTAMSLI